MGTITRINVNNLFWLGRYTERVFITLNSFFKYADRIIEKGDDFYKNYLSDISVPNIYKNSADFYDRYVFDENDPNSIYSNLERALGNGIVLREEIKTPSLSYLQMAADKFKSARGTDKIRYDLLPVRDAIYAFWGSVDSNMTDLDALKIIHLGKSVEHVDMLLRLSLSEEETCRYAPAALFACGGNVRGAWKSYKTRREFRRTKRLHCKQSGSVRLEIPAGCSRKTRRKQERFDC